ncbi:unnamed protein product [Bursaphelenchus xylophilus]|uniref:(pine wood nematode) hypothetical protein n=1 Tax=Bursaphelenchus xylophilus TaxID=6326 RepID=A0A1I7RZH6_BURXY|nr:unnamed protein product [Bursaphelenchus xylophilus]CAG9106372.1 unnamed protein product [Bursaphelenchus xylophilus]
MSTGVLGYIRGVDFSHNDFSGDRFPQEVAQMAHATWLKLNDTKLEHVPDELSDLTKLEHLQMTRNSLQNIHGELSDLPKLRSVIFRRNQIKTSGIPTDIFRMKDLTIIDFSHNSLRDVPNNVEYAKCAIVLNLSHNNLESIPNLVFNNLIDLIFLDLSHNKVDNLPVQLKRLVNLQILKLSFNPLKSFQFPTMTMQNLRVLHLRNTNRTAANFPLTFNGMENIQELDLAENALEKLPESVYELKKLRKLDISHNKLTEVNVPDDALEELETVNFSDNELLSLPEGIVKCSRLRRIYANFNKITFEGMPKGIGKLLQLQILYLSHNRLQLIPEGVSRCVKLQRLKLDSNGLRQIPDGLYLLPDLKELDLTNNPEIVMPPKPNDKAKALAFYNIDFSLSHRMPNHTTNSSNSSVDQGRRDAMQRKKDFIKRRRHQADEDGASKVIAAMSKMAKNKDDDDQPMENGDSLLKAPPSWRERMANHQKKLDVSHLFEADVGQYAGLWIWDIENFYPSPTDPSVYGHFYESDCYIILKTNEDENGHLTHQIYYWIGDKASLDKGMCAAVHAVHLRNHLGSDSSTHREDMNDESDEFLDLFDDDITYISGGRTQSGFYTVVKPKFVTRLYRGSVEGQKVNMEPVSLNYDSLDPRFVFLLHTEKTIWIWRGVKASNTTASKVRLFASKLNKRDRKDRAEIEECTQTRCPPEFWMDFIGQPKRPREPIIEHVPDDFKPPKSILYMVKMGMGSMELPQVELKGNKLHKDVLRTDKVFILDCTSDLFLWMGKKANRLLKLAGQKIAAELHTMIQRPEYTDLCRENEGEESTWFRQKFAGWDDVIRVDYTMTAETVQRRGADIKVIMEKDKLKVETEALFTDRLPGMSHEESEILMEECNADLEVIESFVLEGKKFVRLPKNEFGTFCTKDCYVFLCRYYVTNDDSDFSDEDSSGATESGSSIEQKKPDQDQPDDFKCVVYFWQGRDAGNMGWLHFTFTLQKKFESLFKDKLEVVRMYQQQENHKFLSHFQQKLTIKRGSRAERIKNPKPKVPELYQMRANGSSVNTRTIQIETSAKNLNSAFGYILLVPNDQEVVKKKKVAQNGDADEELGDEEEEIPKYGDIYVWFGDKSDTYYHRTLRSIANEMLNAENNYDVVEIYEGHEPEDFWTALGGKKKYSKDAEFMNYTRLFRCTNEKGHFCVSEKTVDFCQDDLDNDDVMIVDSGKYVLMWCGTTASEVECKLAYQAANAYVNNLKMKGQERQLMLSVKGLESKRFRELFHGWSHHKDFAASVFDAKYR